MSIVSAFLFSQLSLSFSSLLLQFLLCLLFLFVQSLERRERRRDGGNSKIYKSAMCTLSDFNYKVESREKVGRVYITRYLSPGKDRDDGWGKEGRDEVGRERKLFIFVLINTKEPELGTRLETNTEVENHFILSIKRNV